MQLTQSERLKMSLLSTIIDSLFIIFTIIIVLILVGSYLKISEEIFFIILICAFLAGILCFLSLNCWMRSPSSIILGYKLEAENNQKWRIIISNFLHYSLLFLNVIVYEEDFHVAFKLIGIVSLFDLVYPFFSTDSVWFTAKLMKVKIVKPKKKEHDNDGIVI